MRRPVLRPCQMDFGISPALTSNPGLCGRMSTTSASPFPHATWRVAVDVSPHVDVGRRLAETQHKHAPCPHLHVWTIHTGGVYIHSVRIFRPISFEAVTHTCRCNPASSSLPTRSLDHPLDHSLTHPLLKSPSPPQSLTLLFHVTLHFYYPFGIIFSPFPCLVFCWLCATSQPGPLPRAMGLLEGNGTQVSPCVGSRPPLNIFQEIGKDAARGRAAEGIWRRWEGGRDAVRCGYHDPMVSAFARGEDVSSIPRLVDGATRESDETVLRVETRAADAAGDVAHVRDLPCDEPMTTRRGAETESSAWIASSTC